MKFHQRFLAALMLASVPCHAAFQIEVKFMHAGKSLNRKIPLEIKPSDTIGEVREQIHVKIKELANIPPESKTTPLTLIFDGEHLSEKGKLDTPISETKLTANSTIHAIITAKQQETTDNVSPFVPMLPEPKWRRYNFGFDPFGLEPQPFKITPQPRELPSLPPKPKLPSLPAKHTGTSFKIDVCPLGRENFTLKVGETDTCVRHVKEKIHSHYVSSRTVYGPDYGKKAPTPDKQELVFGNRVWGDEESIHTWPGKSGPSDRPSVTIRFRHRRLTNQRLIDRFIRESIRCQQS